LRFLQNDDGPDWVAARGLQGRFADEHGVRRDTLLGAAAWRGTSREREGW
jgi:hypothetical protein